MLRELGDSFILFILAKPDPSDKGNDSHLATAFGREESIYFIDFFNHLCPAFAGNISSFFLDERKMD